MKKKMLLHSCCGPCTCGVAPQLKDYDVTLLYYNPNIDSLEEYTRRLEALETAIKNLNKDFDLDLKLIAIPYDHTEFTKKILGLENEKEGGNRCTKCFYLRLGFTANYAKEHNFDIWASTLSVSPHKNHELLNAIGKELEKNTCEYYPSNFKKNNGFLMSVQLSKKYGIYRQKYCGCTPYVEPTIIQKDHQ